MILKPTAVLIALLLPTVNTVASDSHLDSLYLESEFQQIMDSLTTDDRDSLSVHDRLLLIESLSRIGRGYDALQFLNDLMRDNEHDSRLLTAAAIAHQSIGRFHEAMVFADSAVLLNPKSTDALLTKATLHLNLRQLDSAGSSLEKAIDIDSALFESKLHSDIAAYVFTACGDADALGDLYRKQAEFYERTGRSTDAHAARMNYLMYAEVDDGDLFTTEADSDIVVLPLMRLYEDHSHRYVPLTVNGATYKVLIDTGNRLGWTVHDGSLEQLLVSKQGGAFTTSSAIMRRNIPGRYVLSDCIDFGEFRITNAIGVSFRKLRSDFPDAILNPVFIRDRVVTIDFLSDRLIFRTKARFDRDILADSAKPLIRVPYFGYRWPYIPVTVNGKHEGIAMIETGSAASWLRQGFVEANGISVEQDSTTDHRDSQNYPVTRASISVGDSLIADGTIRVSSMRYCDPVTGLVESVLIHAGVFDHRYCLTFDPFDNQVILHKE